MGKYFSREKWLYPFYVMTHPADGFYEIRHRGRGSVPIAIVITLAFSLSYSLNRILASFVVNDVNPRSVDSVTELQGVFLLFFLFCIGNWSITCLMEGEGRLKDIVTVLGYALLPLVLTYLPATLVSQFVAQNEEGFYSIILMIGTAWGVILAFVGIMIVHNYSTLKTIVTLILTVVAMLIIIFIALLLSDLVNQVYGFFQSIYTELIFRN